jgi:hypothetical protein
MNKELQCQGSDNSEVESFCTYDTITFRTPAGHCALVNRLFLESVKRKEGLVMVLYITVVRVLPWICCRLFLAAAPNAPYSSRHALVPWQIV